MKKRINFEDNLFILNVRIRMIRDMLRLDPDSGLFLEQTLLDLQFIDTALDALIRRLIENTKLMDRETVFDSIADIEWQYRQLLTECTGAASPFETEEFPEISDRILRLHNSSAARKKTIDKAGEPGEPGEQTGTEPVVSFLELNELLQKL